MNKKFLISVLVPCYNEQESLPLFYKAFRDLRNSLKTEQLVETELIFVNDGSGDNTQAIIEELASTDNTIRYIAFSRNFGKEAAILAGLKYAHGDYIALMDADMQDPPDLLKEMFSILQSEPQTDCVAARRISRKGEPPVRSFFARCFYKLINQTSKSEIVNGARDFRLMTRRMANAVLSLNEYNRFSKGIFSWVGFHTHWIAYKNHERIAGKTKWSFWGLTRYALDGIYNFSDLPMQIVNFLGITISVIGFVGFISLLLGAAFQLIFPTWLYGLFVLIGLIGIQIICIGFIGRYCAKTYAQTQARPHYIIAADNLSATDNTHTDIAL